LKNLVRKVALAVHFFRHCCCGMYPLARMRSVTDRQTDGRTDGETTVWCQYPIIVSAAVRSAEKQTGRSEQSLNIGLVTTSVPHNKQAALVGVCSI